MVAEESGLSTIKSDDTLFSIIESLSRENGSRVTAIAEDIGISKSSVHKHLKSMQKHGYVIQKNEKYFLSFKFLTLGGRVRDTNKICDIVQPELHELADETNQMVLFSILEHGEGAFVYRINEKYGIRKVLNLGTRFELHTNASGKAMLAQFEDKQILNIIGEGELVPHTSQTITNIDDLLDQVEEIRDRGYALNLEERREGLHAIACGLYDDETDTHAALCIAGAANQLSEDRLKEDYADRLLNTVNELQLKIRYN